MKYRLYKGNEPLYLSSKDIPKLLRHEIGHGTDGRVLKINNKYLVKIYHSKLMNFINGIDLTTDDNIKIYSRGKVNRNSYTELITYINNSDDEEIKIRTKEAISTAIERQKRIKRTQLPIQPIYIDNRYSGCVLVKKNGIQIHELSNMPLSYKRKILINVLDDVKELLDNNIYHRDLANSPYTDQCIYEENGKIEHVGHSHILVNPITLKTNIIDLDGKSTIYTERASKKYLSETMFNICVLILEFLFNISTNYELTEYDIDIIKFNLFLYNIDNETAEKLVYGTLSFDEAYNLVNSDIKKRIYK